MAKKRTPTKREVRNLRLQQVIWGAVGVIVILAMILALMN